MLMTGHFALLQGAVKRMVNQGLLGALAQYWTVDEKPRLNRKNTYFEDALTLSNADALRLGIVATSAIAIIVISWSLVGVVL